jgi:hypothetical protein
MADTLAPYKPTMTQRIADGIRDAARSAGLSYGVGNSAADVANFVADPVSSALDAGMEAGNASGVMNKIKALGKGAAGVSLATLPLPKIKMLSRITKEDVRLLERYVGFREGEGLSLRDYPQFDNAEDLNSMLRENNAEGRDFTAMLENPHVGGLLKAVDAIISKGELQAPATLYRGMDEASGYVLPDMRKGGTLVSPQFTSFGDRATARHFSGRGAGVGFDSNAARLIRASLPSGTPIIPLHELLDFSARPELAGSKEFLTGAGKFDFSKVRGAPEFKVGYSVFTSDKRK